MASAKQIAWRKKFARMSKAGKFRKKTMHEERMIKGRPKSNKVQKSNLHNDDGYYITKEPSGLFALRQKRFKDRLVIGKDGQRKQHPHDIMALGRTRAEIVKMRKNIGFSADQLAESES